MSNNIIKMNLKRTTIEKIDLLIKIYSVTCFKVVITDKELEFLRAYIYTGYNEQTKKGLEVKYSRGNINTTNASLQKKGFLKPKPYKQDKELHPEFEKLRQEFILKKTNMLLLNFE